MARTPIGLMVALVALWYAVTGSDARAAECSDCNGDGSVGISELITAINIALGTAELTSCGAVDRDSDGSVTIAELVTAITHALDGCPALASPTPTPTPGGASQVPPNDEAALHVWLEAGSYLAWQAESAPHDGTGPHGGVVRVFLNDALVASLSGGETQHPPGAAAVKELYGSGSTVVGWAVSVKLEPDSDRGRGWYWYETLPGFTISGIGNPACTGCHSSGRDFLRIPFPLQ